VLSVVAAVVLGMSSLLIFLTPQQIVDSFWHLQPREFGLSVAVFLIGCWITAERWRACLGYRASRWVAFHTMGVCNAGNLLIPGRIGEPLRVFLLAELDVPVEYGTSAVVQERLADQLLRVLFLAATILVADVGGGGELGSRLVGVTLATVVLVSLCVTVVKSRTAVARTLAIWISRLPKLTQESVESFVLRTLSDLGTAWSRPGGKTALFWGLLAWIVMAAHTELILASFFTKNTLACALLIMALSPTTAPTQPGLFHGMALGGMVIMGVDKVPALQAAVVIHMIQMVVFTLWGATSWFALARVLQKRKAQRARGFEPESDSPSMTED
jgi:lysylphosphatidylglycerol synthase-like protein